MDRLQAMTAFLTVLDTGGFASAARKLKVSPSVVTRMVGELEDAMGVRLLTRTTRMVRVTDTGAEYAERCRRILADIEEAEQSATSMHGNPRGLLSITSSMLFGKMYVTPIVTEYLGRYNEVDISCWFLDRIVNIVDEGIDVAIRLGELPDSSMQAVRVGRVRRVVCASPAYLERHGIPEAPDELAGHQIVSASGVSSLSEWRFGTDERRQSVRVKPRMTTTTNDSAISAVVSGLGLTQLLSYQVAQQLREGTLKAVLVDFEPPPLPIHVLHREGRHVTRKVRTFLDLAIERLRENTSLN
ncbi:LysR family transcriptional regulator [Paraburkholderia sp. BL10I2N1]|uniref:LysR family transcriptional regulator n=1 Tax=Paraburkholderia sp. BL10I2N1 TaxID=1938796 RepID=UPI00105D6DCE|nr:LysR family transcriptional regulator [Paraburkholderia sp. BL10I2N1]TDN70750.1 LysR family transcriptional regulator [Paraburkholderia sp. BL10I2N1]